MLKIIFLALFILSVLAAGMLVCGTGCAVASTGSVYRGTCTHLGARAHGDAVQEWVGTVRVSTDWPVCREVYP